MKSTIAILLKKVSNVIGHTYEDGITFVTPSLRCRNERPKGVVHGLFPEADEMRTISELLGLESPKRRRAMLDGLEVIDPGPMLLVAQATSYHINKRCVALLHVADHAIRFIRLNQRHGFVADEPQGDRETVYIVSFADHPFTSRTREIIISKTMLGHESASRRWCVAPVPGRTTTA